MDECDNKSVARDLCRKHHPTGNGWSRGIRETKRRADRKRTQWRRAKVSDSGAELIDRDEIGARDGWRCGLCHLRVDRLLGYPNPMSASLDHIQPLSLGGLHARANVQIAHLSCNISKGNRVANDQLLLFG